MALAMLNKLADTEAFTSVIVDELEERVHSGKRSGRAVLLCHVSMPSPKKSFLTCRLAV